MQRITQFLKAFRNDTRGAIILIGAVAMGLTIGLGGAAYDFGIQQMAIKNGQFAADLAATSGSAARLHENLDPDGGSAQQRDRVEMYYRLNARGFNVDPAFRPLVAINNDGERFVTRVEGQSSIRTSFIGALGIPELQYTIETQTELRDPGEPTTFDMVLLLDYTSSMIDNEIAPGVTRLQALQQASTFLTNTLICGNESGENCEDLDSRGSIIPYALGPIGLDPCDLPGAPSYCQCIPPRGVDPDDFEPPEDPCVEPCERTGAADPTSTTGHFRCPCVPEEDRPDSSAIVSGVNPLVLADPTEPQASYATRCLPSCMDGGCCPPKCVEGGGPDTCPYAPGTQACAECQVNSFNARKPICCAALEIVEGDPDGGTGWGIEKVLPLPPQTIACHNELCTASCSASGGGQDPCVTNPAMCENPCDGPNPPSGCGQTREPRPQIPDLGFNQHAPKTFYAQSEKGEVPTFSAIYDPAGSCGQGAQAKLILTQAAGGLFAVSLEECLDAGQLGCFDELVSAINNDYTEGNTNSAAAFDALAMADSYLPFMRPSNEEPDVEAVRIAIWVTDGLNNRYQFEASAGSSSPPIVIPQSEFVDDAWQAVPDQLDEILQNHYAFNGSFQGTGDEDEDIPGLTAQEWSNRQTLMRCQQFRERMVDGEERPIIMYAVAVGDVGNLQTEEGQETAALMNECVYGDLGAGRTTDEPPVDPATGQQLPPQFFAVQDVQSLNTAFRTIAGALGNIRITD